MQLIRKIKQRFQVLAGKKTLIKKELDCDRAWYGNNYGGFYINPTLLNEKSIVYSFGIGEDISFDTAIIRNHNCQVYAFDPTPKSVNWVNMQSLPPYFKFYPFGINKTTGFVEFNLPKDKKFVSGSVINHKNVDDENCIKVPMKSFADITLELGHQHVDVLKMDIEGSEYDVIDSLLSSKVQITQILVEIHERFFPNGIEKTEQLLKIMSHHGYAVFAVSSSLEELSFIKKELMENY